MTIHSILRKKFVAPLLLAFMFATTPASANELKDIAKMAEEGQQDEALTRINAYLDANKKDAQGLFTKGIILAESGQRDAAISTFNVLTKTYPNLPEPYNNLAVLYADAGKYDLAKKALETAIKTHPSYATAHENLGDIYARMASEAYDKALKLDNGNSRAQSKLSLIKDLFSDSPKTVIATNNSTTTRPIRKAEPVAPTPAKTTPPVTAKPIPALKEQPETVVDNTSKTESNVKAAADAWATAWSSQNINKYLASYAKDFKPGKGRSLSSWKKLRKNRVTSPASIKLKLSNRKVTVIDEKNAKISFKQFYQAKGRSAIHTFKTLVMKKSGSKWLIKKEIASN